MSTQTRHVLGGCYKGKSVSSRTLLTHLVFMTGDTEVKTGCRQSLESLADQFSDPNSLNSRPTCPTCAKKWDKLHNDL